MNEVDPVTIELNPREQRLYDRVRSQLVDARPGDGSGVRDLLLLLPDLTILCARLLRDSRVPLTRKATLVLGIAYVLSPIDLVPVVFFGPVGLLDDLFVIGTALSRLVNGVHPDVVRSHWSGQGDALDVVQRLTRWTEKQLRFGFRGRLRPRAR